MFLAWQFQYATGKSDVDYLLSLMVQSSYLPEDESSSHDINLQMMHLLNITADTPAKPTMAPPLPNQVQHRKRGRRRKQARLRPLEQLKVPAPIFVLSLPKSGTSSMYMYFTCGGVYSTHTYSKTGGRLGSCMMKNYFADAPLLDGCHQYEKMFSDIGYIGKSKLGETSCFYPSLQALDRIVRDYPNSTIIVSYRSTGWHDSIKTYNGLKKRWMSLCDAFPNTTEPQVWEDFYAEHRRRIRQAVQGHPSIQYMEFDLKDPTAGHQLENFTGISHECFGNCKPNFRCTYKS